MPGKHSWRSAAHPPRSTALAGSVGARHAVPGKHSWRNAAHPPRSTALAGSVGARHAVPGKHSRRDAAHSPIARGDYAGVECGSLLPPLLAGACPGGLARLAVAARPGKPGRQTAAASRHTPYRNLAAVPGAFCQWFPLCLRVSVANAAFFATKRCSQASYKVELL